MTAARTIGDALARLEAQLFVGRDDQLALFGRWLASPEPTPAILNVSGPGGVGKSALLRAFRRAAEATGRSVMVVDGYSIPADPDALLHALTGGDPEQAIGAINAARPLLEIDTFEQLGNLTPYLETLLGSLEPGVKIVVSGRLPVGRALSRQVPWHEVILPMPLTALSRAETATLLARRSITDTALVDQVFAATHGYPLGVSMAVDLAEQFGVRDFGTASEWRLRIRSLVERLLRDLPDPEVRALLDACAVVRHFDEATLAEIAGLDDAGPAFDRLCRLSIVRPSDHGLMLHNDVSHFFAADLRWRRPERWRELVLRRADYYRRRARVVGAEEREWLVAERLYLWSNAFAHTMLFGEDDPDEVWVVPGGPDDAEELWTIYAGWVRSGFGSGSVVAFDEYSLDDARPFFMAVLTHPDLRLRVARDRGGDALGFSAAMPVTASTYALLSPNPIVGPVLRAYFEADEVAALPGRPEDARVIYLLHLASGAVRRGAVTSALLRERFGLFARSHVYLAQTAVPSYKEVFEALGFRRVDGARHTVWAADTPADGYVLDLSRLGVEAWIEAIVAGHTLPKAMKPSEFEEELRLVLAAWNDDALLARSLLVQLTPTSNEATDAQRADGLRAVVRSTLDRVRQDATPDATLAYQALELAYLDKRTSHERAAEQMSVSRSQFYRLLTRATASLAAAFGGPSSPTGAGLAGHVDSGTQA